MLMFHRQKPVPQTPGIDRIDPSLLNARYPPDFVPFSNQPPNDSLFSRRVSRQRHPGRASLLLSRHMSLCHEENWKKKNFADTTCKFVRYRVARLDVQTHRKYATSNRLNAPVTKPVVRMRQTNLTFQADESRTISVIPLAGTGGESRFKAVHS